MTRVLLDNSMAYCFSTHALYNNESLEDQLIPRFVTVTINSRVSHLLETY